MDKSPLEEYLCCRRGRRVLKGSGWCTETPLRRARVRPTAQEGGGAPLRGRRDVFVDSL